MHNKFISLLVLSILSIGLVACNSSTSTEPTETETQTPPVGTNIFGLPATPKSDDEAQHTQLSSGNPLIPDEAYVEITNGEKLVYLYQGLSQMPIDYDAIASSTVRDYRFERDEFKKRDILAALKPKIESDIKAASAQRYLKFRANDPGLYSEYDFNKKAFKQSAISSGTRISFGDYGQQIGFTNATAFELVPVPDEAQARKLSAVRSKYRDVTLDIYLYAQEADLNDKIIKCQIMKMIYKTNDGLEIVVK